MKSKTTCKLTARWVVVLMALIWTSVPTAMAQNTFIKEIYYYRSDKSIVRQIDDTSWITYNRQREWSVFILSTKTDPQAKVLDLGISKIDVNDFEISGNTLYFCGTTLDQTPGVAIVGKFSISSFPSGLVHSARLNEMVSFDRMELVNSDIGPHMVIVGHTREMDYRFVDVHESYPYLFHFNVYTGTEEVAQRLDDIAVTKQYVVFTGHNSATQRPILFYLNHPTGGFYPSTLSSQYVECQYTARQQIWIEHCEEDAIATATLNQDNTLYVSAFLGTTHLSTQYFLLNQGINSCADLNYSRESKYLDVLTRYTDGENYKSTIYHFYSALINLVTGVVQGHEKDSYWLNSLVASYINAPGPSGYFVATGASDEWYLSLHRYLYSAFPCWNKVEKTAVRDLWSSQPLIKELLGKTYTVESQILPSEKYQVEIRNRCTPKQEGEDE